MTTYDKDHVKQTARGCWRGILGRICNLTDEQMSAVNKGVPCPKCGGDDRFAVFSDFDETGGVNCRHCHYENNQDGFATIQWILDVDFPTAVGRVALDIGYNEPPPIPNTPVATETESATPSELANDGELAIDAMARIKHVSRESLAAYGAQELVRLVTFPQFNAEGKQCSTFTVKPFSKCELEQKGKNAPKKPAGVFLPVVEGKPRLPVAGEHWCIVEGVKDAAALHSLGFNACGTNGAQLAKKFAPLFTGVDVTVVPDRDTEGVKGSLRTSLTLNGTAKSTKIAELPSELRAAKGDDVRDILRRDGGRELVLKAIAEAQDAGESKEEINKKLAPESKAISNGVVVEIETPEGVQEKTLPLRMADIIARVNRFTNNRLMRVGDSLYVSDESMGVYRLQNAASLFGWLQQFCFVEWHNGNGRGFATKDEVFHEIRRTANSFIAIETWPHEPPIAQHFYTCETPVAGNGEMLDKFVALFRPATPIDSDLIRAMIVTTIWGGPAGTRPIFVVTSDAGRGVGKSKCVQVISQVVGGYLDISANEDISQLKSRLLSDGARQLRIAILDNVKSLRFSWAEFESLNTSPTISGKQLYVGEGTRPNNLLWFVTLNGPALSEDIAQRCVIIKLRPAESGENTPTWYENATKFVVENRQEIIGDCIAFLREPSAALATYSRWAAWEHDVLSRLPEPSDAQKVIAERQGEANVDRDEAALIEEFFAGKLEQIGYPYADTACVRIPNTIAAAWFGQAVGERVTTTKSTQKLKQMASERQLRFLAPDSVRTYGRCFVWTGANAGDRLPDNDLEQRIAQYRAESEATHTLAVEAFKEKRCA